MATLEMVRAQFPEINGVSDILVLAMLNAASLDMSTLVWGAFGAIGAPQTKADQGQMYLAMHKLAMSPAGQNARMVVNSKARGFEKTTYGSQYWQLLLSVTSGFRVS